MNIRKEESVRKRRGARFDRAKDLWVGYRVDARVDGKRVRPLFPTKAEAEAFAARLHVTRVYRRVGVKPPTLGTVRFSELTTRRLSRIKNEKEIVRAKRVFGDFASILGGDPNVETVRKSHVLLYINQRLDEGVKAATVRREINIISTALKQAAELFPLELEGYEPPSVPRPRTSRRKRYRRTIEPHEKDRMIESILFDRLPLEHRERTQSRATVARMFELAWMLGLRFTEVKKLRKSDYDTKLRLLRVTRWKTGDVSDLEFLPDRVIEILNSQMDTEGEFLFPIGCSDTTFARIIRDACEAAGIPYGRNTLDGVTFHSTRHSFTTRMTEVTDLATTGSYTGHSSAEMVDYYSHASKRSKRLAMQKMYCDLPDTNRRTFDAVRSGSMDFDAYEREIRALVG